MPVLRWTFGFFFQALPFLRWGLVIPFGMVLPFCRLGVSDWRHLSKQIFDLLFNEKNMRELSITHMRSLSITHMRNTYFMCHVWGVSGVMCHDVMGYVRHAAFTLSQTAGIDMRGMVVR